MKPFTIKSLFIHEKYNFSKRFTFWNVFKFRKIYIYTFLMFIDINSYAEYTILSFVFFFSFRYLFSVGRRAQ